MAKQQGESDGLYDCGQSLTRDTPAAAANLSADAPAEVLMHAPLPASPCQPERAHTALTVDAEILMSKDVAVKNAVSKAAADAAAYIGDRRRLVANQTSFEEDTAENGLRGPTTINPRIRASSNTDTNKVGAGNGGSKRTTI